MTSASAIDWRFRNHYFNHYRVCERYRYLSLISVSILKFVFLCQHLGSWGEYILKISKCVAKISKYVVKISKCVVKISKCVVRISKCDVQISK